MIWNPGTDTKIAGSDSQLIGHGGVVHGVGFDPKGKILQF